MLQTVIMGDGPQSVALAPDARAAWTRDSNGVLIRVSPPAAPRGGATATNNAPAGAPRPQ